MNFVKQGKGRKTLVFLHGWGGSWQSWAPIIERLKAKYLIYALDLPGFGNSPLPKPYSLSDYSLELYNFMNMQHVSKPVLIGHSFGGQVAAKFAVQNSGLLSGLVLVDSATKRNNSPLLKLNIVLAKLGKKVVGSKFRNFYYKMRGWENSDYLKAATVPFLQETAGIIFREDISPDIAKISVKTLIFWGERDTDTLLKIGEEIHQKIAGSRLVVAPGAGHFSYLDNQELFCKELEKFI